MAGWRYRWFRLTDIFKYDELQVKWICKGTKNEASISEAEILDQYRRVHYELPPLNYKYNWKLIEGLNDSGQ